MRNAQLRDSREGVPFLCRAVAESKIIATFGQPIFKSS